MTAPRPSVPGLSDDAPEYRVARVAALRDYLTANKDRFTVQALRDAAIDAGYQPAEIEAAIAAGEPHASIGIWSRTVFVTAVAFAVVTWLAIYLAAQPLSPVPASWAVAAALAVGGVGWFLLRDRRSDVSQGLACGVLVAIVVPVALLIAFVGICTVLFAQTFG